MVESKFSKIKQKIEKEKEKYYTDINRSEERKFLEFLKEMRRRADSIEKARATRKAKAQAERKKEKRKGLVISTDINDVLDMYHIGKSKSKSKSSSNKKSFWNL